MVCLMKILNNADDNININDTDYDDMMIIIFFNNNNFIKIRNNQRYQIITRGT